MSATDYCLRSKVHTPAQMLQGCTMWFALLHHLVPCLSPNVLHAQGINFALASLTLVSQSVGICRLHMTVDHQQVEECTVCVGTCHHGSVSLLVAVVLLLWHAASCQYHPWKFRFSFRRQHGSDKAPLIFPNGSEGSLRLEHLGHLHYNLKTKPSKGWGGRARLRGAFRPHRSNCMDEPNNRTAAIAASSHDNTYVMHSQQ